MSLARPGVMPRGAPLPYEDGPPGSMTDGPARWGQVAGQAPHGGVPNATQHQRYPARWVPPSPVFDAYRFSRWIPMNITLGTASQLVIAAPDIYRTVLLLSCPSGSPGSVFIAFDNPATAGSAIFTLTAGAVVLLDFNVPQNDVYAAGSVANTLANLAYANVPFTPGA